jgi:hypothetical protein
LQHLDYHQDTETGDLLDMVMPADEELQTPMKSEDRTLLTPGLGSPGTDAAYSNWLQNPDSYGPLSKIKQLPMINSKVHQWNGK